MPLLQRFLRQATSSLRGRLVLGLLPGFLALLFLLVIGLYATGLLANANTHLAETGLELAVTRSMQVKLQQSLIPLHDFTSDHALEPAEARERLPDDLRNFQRLAAELEGMFAQAASHYQEAEEQRLLARVIDDWGEARRRADAIFSLWQANQPPNAEEATSASAAVEEIYRSIWDSLELLSDEVFGEMQRTVQASQTAQEGSASLLIISTLVAAIAGLIFVLLFSRYITNPIQALARGAAQIGSGDLSFRLALQRQDEVGALAQAFDRMAERLQDAYQHLEERVAERTGQLRTLNEASQSVVGDLNLERVLQTIANLARDLGNAQYAAVLVPRSDGQALPRFITSQDPHRDAIAALPPPVGRGLLGLLLQAETPVRLERLADHPAASGFPPGHPPMTSFLGVPIRVHGRSIGGLYLTDKQGSESFDSEDEQLLSMLAAYAGIAIENARLYSELTGMNEALEERVQARTAELEAVSAERARYALQLRQVLNRTVRVQEEERKRIAKEIHDGVSQWLMGALFEMQAARVRLPEELAEVAQHLSEAQRVLKEVKLEMRRVIYDLHPPLLESNGLVAALRGHINETQTHSHVTCQCQVSGNEYRLPPDQALALFRIAQEAMHNAMRHAQADRVDVSLAYAPDSVQLTVADEGRGFVPDAARQDGEQPHWGLLGMQERATAVGASLRIDSAPGQGTRISVVLPTPGKNGTGDCAAEDALLGELGDGHRFGHAPVADSKTWPQR